MSFAVGEEVGGYLILARCGAGGMGTVYKVRHILSGRIEAMKVLAQSLATDEDLRRRFHNEIQTLARLNHANIAAFHTAQEIKGELAMLMEFIEGETIGDVINKPALTLDLSLNYVKQVLLALEYAHKHGVVHRDIKPTNIMVNSQGLVKVVDFGIAKTNSNPNRTQVGLRMGSARYMSPEQVKGETVDERSDFYSLGLVLYQLITRRHPFSGQTEEFFAAHLEQTPPVPRDLNDQIPRWLNDVVMRALEKDPARRFQNARDFLIAISQNDAPQVAERPSTVDPINDAARKLTGVEHPRTQSGTKIWRARLRRIAFYSAAVFVVAVVFVLSFSLLGGGGSPGPSNSGHSHESDSKSPAIHESHPEIESDPKIVKEGGSGGLSKPTAPGPTRESKSPGSPVVTNKPNPNMPSGAKLGGCSSHNQPPSQTFNVAIHKESAATTSDELLERLEVSPGGSLHLVAQDGREFCLIVRDIKRLRGESRFRAFGSSEDDFTVEVSEQDWPSLTERLQPSSPVSTGDMGGDNEWTFERTLKGDPHFRLLLEGIARNLTESLPRLGEHTLNDQEFQERVRREIQARGGSQIAFAMGGQPPNEGRKYFDFSFVLENKAMVLMKFESTKNPRPFQLSQEYRLASADVSPGQYGTVGIIYCDIVQGRELYLFYPEARGGELMFSTHATITPTVFK